MTLFQFASASEAEPLIKALELQKKPISGDIPKYSDGNYCVIVTGNGKLNCAVELFSAIKEFEPEIIINAGIAGSIIDTHSLGKVYEVGKVIEGERKKLFGNDPVYFDLKKYTNLPSAILVTSDQPVYSATQREYIKDIGGEIVDMEGFAFAKVAVKTSLKAIILKSISDQCNEDTSRSIEENISMSSKTLAKTILNHFCS